MNEPTTELQRSTPRTMSLLMLAYCYATLFFLGSAIAPAATEFIALSNKHPQMIVDPRAHFVLAALLAWGFLGVVCSLLVQVLNRELTAPASWHTKAGFGGS